MPPKQSPPLDREATWATIRKTLDRLFTFSEDIGRNTPAPSLTPAEWMGAYSAVFTWTQAMTVTRYLNGRSHSESLAPELYPKIEEYFGQLCESLRARLDTAPREDLASNHATLYDGFCQRILIIERIAQSLDRGHTANRRSEGEGWLRGRPPSVDSQIPQGRIYSDGRGGWVQEAVMTPEHLREPQEVYHQWATDFSKIEQEALVKQYELSPNASHGDISWKAARIRAEAGSNPAQVRFISIHALGLRRWRLDVLEPLLRDCPDLIPSTSSLVNDDVPALARLAQSMKEVGMKADDERRQRLEQLLKSGEYM
jgi:hypothetical protein